jgi:outer membrane lipoprotein SlyB
MKKVFLALAIIMAITVTSCKHVDAPSALTRTDSTAVDTTKVDTAAVDTTKVDSIKVK